MRLAVRWTELGATLTPTPNPTATIPTDVAPDPNSVTPGLLGFLVVFVLAIALWLLFRNLTGKLRRMRFREDQRLAQEAVENATSPTGVPGTVPGVPPTGGAGPTPRDGKRR